MITTDYLKFLNDNSTPLTENVNVSVDIDKFIYDIQEINKKIKSSVDSILSGATEPEVKYPTVGQQYNYESRSGGTKLVTILSITSESGVTVEEEVDGVKKQYTIGKDRVNKFTPVKKETPKEEPKAQEEQFTQNKY